MFSSSPENGTRIRTTARGRTVAAWILLTLPLFAYPLEWLTWFDSRLSAWDLVGLFTLPVLAMAALAVLLYTGIADLRRAVGASRVDLIFVSAAVLLLLLSLGRSVYLGRRLEPAEWFLPLVPLAGMVLSREILRILPAWGTLVLAVLLCFTWHFPLCIGLPGNWNWNFSLLAVLIPAPFLLSRRLPARHFWLAVLAAALFLTAISSAYRELVPRGTIVGVVAASAALWLLWKIPGRQRLLIILLGCGAGIAMFLSIWLGPADSTIRSSRFWLWRGSMELALSRSLVGVGEGNFSRHINPLLPREYYFSDYATNFHPHPHNEFLAVWCTHGVMGVVAILFLTLAAGTGFRSFSAVRTWCFWLVLVLSVHGQFDVLLGTPLAGTLWLVVGGALAGRPRRGGVSHPAGGLAGAVLTVTLAVVVFCSGWWARESLLSSRSGDPVSAKRQLEKSLAWLETAEARYRLGMVELFDFRNPRAAIPHFEKLAPGYVHSNGYLARAYAAAGDPETALRYFDRESNAYPMSALNAFWELEVMRVGGYDPVVLSSLRSRLVYLLKLRGLSIERIDELIAKPTWDDLPLRNP